ncbi:hypothetical protein H2200_004986 [Cladophialophora chaetospira]|uniref:BTB domain-containing protein n=1 Tax=Cladophialophora chaetospira TaxID=386627 RepID=A0AA38XB83_9EURO|nr:hypothetical protein H2200_004986 [Cladophialophora chaetospira]
MAEANDTTLIGSPASKRKADEMDAPEEKPEVKLVEVIPDADLLLKVGGGSKVSKALDIKVSSMVMSLVSPVFKVILSSAFQEAATKTIILDEDDPDVILTFCEIVHHRSPDLRKLTNDQLVDLAVFADMRQCQSVLLPWIRTVTADIQELVRHEEGFLDIKLTKYSTIPPYVLVADVDRKPRLCVRDLLEIASTFSWKMDFWYATRQYMAQYPTGTGSEEVIIFADEKPGLVNAKGQGVCDAIRQQSGKYTEKFLRAIFRLISREISTTAEWYEHKKRVCQTHKHGTLHLLLRERGIVPEDAYKHHHHHSLAETMITVSKLASDLKWGVYTQMTTDCTIRRSTKNGTKDCDYCQRNFGDELLELVKEHTDDLPGVCMHCFRAGKEDFFTPKWHAERCRFTEAENSGDSEGTDCATDA